MRLVIAAVGRLKPGPERTLAEDYRTRIAGIGKGLGWRPPETLEHDESRAATAELRKTQEAAALLRACPEGAMRIVLDERGKPIDSAAFAALLQRAAEEGRSAACLLIGGPDGHDPSLRDSADHLISFGAMTWPHRLVRLMLLEQLYRAGTILAGHPYHRA